MISSGSLPVAVIPPLDVERLRSTGALEKGHMLADMRTSISMPYSSIAVANKLIRTNCNLAKRFLRATMKGRAYMLAYRDGTIKNLQEYNKGATPKMLRIDYDTTITGMTADGTVSDDMARRDAKIRAGLIKVKGKIRPLSEIYNYLIVREVNRELKSAGWKPKE